MATKTKRAGVRVSSTRPSAGSTAARSRVTRKTKSARQPKVARIELGCPGHFICANDCRWRRHTQVGNYRVSTLGDLFFQHRTGRQTLGASDDSFFETMVFKTTDQFVPGSEDCGCMEVVSFSEIDGTRYATAGAAQRGHERYIAKYLALAAKERA